MLARTPQHAVMRRCFAMSDRAVTLTGMYSPFALKRLKAERDLAAAVKREATAESRMAVLLARVQGDNLRLFLSKSDEQLREEAVETKRLGEQLVTAMERKFGLGDSFEKIARALGVRSDPPEPVRVRGLLSDRADVQRARRKFAQIEKRETDRGKAARVALARSSPPNGTAPRLVVLTLTAPHGPDAAGVPVAA